MTTSSETGSRKFSSTFAIDSEEDYSLVCLPCYRDNITVPASGYCIDCKEHLCPTCFKYHKRATPSIHHKLLDKDAMPTTQHMTDTSVHAGFSDNLTTPCSRHKNETIKLYCHDHGLLLCCICIALEHKSCHVDYIPEISDQMIDSKDYKDITERIDKLLMKCSTQMSDASRNTSTSNDSLETALQEIETHRQRINKRLDELEKAVKDKYEDLQTKNEGKMEAIKTTCEDVMKIMKITYDNMKHFNTSKQGNKLFIEVKQVLKQLQDHENSINSKSEEDIDEYKFVPNKAINDVLQNEKMIGDISTNCHTGLATPSEVRLETSADAIIMPVYVNEINIVTPEDKDSCYVTGMTILPPDRLILVDRNNISLKLVDVNSGFITSQLSLGTDKEDEPWDITSITSTQVAVTVPHRQHIKLISVSDELSLQDTVNTDGDCHYICSYDNKLIVTCMFNAKLEILDMKCRVITLITPESAGENILNEPEYIQANSNGIYVSDSVNHQIIVFNWQGKITGSFEDLETPSGLALLVDGSLLMADYEINSIHQLNGKCNNSKIIQQDVRCPMAICVDNQQNKLYVSRYSYVYKYNNSIVVYNI